MPAPKPIIFWYRQDLRCRDLPGLRAALASDRPVLPCYIHDDAAAGNWSAGGAARWWLHHSLDSLASELAELGATLLIRSGLSA